MLLVARTEAWRASTRLTGGGPLPADQPSGKLGDGHTEGGGLVGAVDLGLNLEIPQGPGSLHQGPAQKGAACQIGGQYHVPGYVLGVHLPQGRHYQGGGAAGEEPLALPQEGEYLVTG